MPITSCQRFFLFSDPPLQLSLAGDCALGCVVLFGIGESHRQSLCRVLPTVAIVVRFETGNDIVGVTNIECVVRTTKDVYPHHPDDDGIVNR